MDETEASFNGITKRYFLVNYHVNEQFGSAVYFGIVIPTLQCKMPSYNHFDSSHHQLHASLDEHQCDIYVQIYKCKTHHNFSLLCHVNTNNNQHNNCSKV